MNMFYQLFSFFDWYWSVDVSCSLFLYILFFLNLLSKHLSNFVSVFFPVLLAQAEICIWNKQYIYLNLLNISQASTFFKIRLLFINQKTSWNAYKKWFCAKNFRKRTLCWKIQTWLSFFGLYCPRLSSLWFFHSFLSVLLTSLNNRSNISHCCNESG